MKSAMVVLPFMRVDALEMDQYHSNVDVNRNPSNAHQQTRMNELCNATTQMGQLKLHAHIQRCCNLAVKYKSLQSYVIPIDAKFELIKDDVKYFFSRPLAQHTQRRFETQ